MTDKVKIKKLLLELKKQAYEKLAKTQGHIKHTSGPVSKSFDEQAMERSNDDVVYCLDNLVRAELSEIETALSKLVNDDYGYCERCGLEIEIERLKTIPYTRTCKSCAHQSQKTANRSI